MDDLGGWPPTLKIDLLRSARRFTALRGGRLGDFETAEDALDAIGSDVVDVLVVGGGVRSTAERGVSKGHALAVAYGLIGGALVDVPDGLRPDPVERMREVVGDKLDGVKVMDDDGTLIVAPLSPWAYIVDELPDLRINDDLAAALSRASGMSKGFWLAMQAQRDERVSTQEAAPSGAVVEGEAVENRPGFALDLPLTDGQAGIIRELLVTYAEESGQAPIWSHAVALAEINGVPRAELEALRSLFPDDGGGR